MQTSVKSATKKVNAKKSGETKLKKSGGAPTSYRSASAAKLLASQGEGGTPGIGTHSSSRIKM